MNPETIKTLRSQLGHLEKYLKIGDRKAKLEQDRQISLSEGFWSDQARATAIMKEIKTNKYWLDLYTHAATAVEDFAVLYEFWKAGEAQESEVEEALAHAQKELEDLEFK